MIRLVLYPKDIEHILGKKRDAVRKICTKIRAANDKPDDIPITINEFCTYVKLDPELVMKLLR